MLRTVSKNKFIRFQVYSLNYPIEDETIVENLVFFIGSRIETVVIDECTVWQKLQIICKILARSKVRNMQITMDERADQTM